MKKSNKYYISKSPRETKKLGEKLSKKLKGGEIIGLIGNLGGGKTTLIKGVAKGLGVKNKILSPTFVLWRLAKMPESKKIKFFCHIDLYRLSKPKDIKSLGLEEYWGRKDSVCLIEWPEKIWPFLKNKKRWLIRFEIINPHTRRIIIKT